HDFLGVDSRRKDFVWLRSVDNFVDVRSTKLQQVSTRNEVYDAKDSIQSIKIPTVFYKLQQGPKSGSGPEGWLSARVQSLGSKPNSRGFLSFGCGLGTTLYIAAI